MPELMDEHATDTRARRAWVRPLLIILASVVFLAVAAEVALRVILPSIVANTIRSEVGLTDDHPVEVSLGGIALPHALVGRVGNLDVHVDEMPLTGEVAGQIDVHADSVPMRATSGEIRGASASITLSDEQLDPAISLITGGFAQTGNVENGELVVGRNIPMFGQEVAVSVSLSLDIADGDLVITPGGITAAGFELSGEQLADFAGGALDPMLATHTLCVRDQLPQGVHLTDIQLSSTGAVTASADLAPDILSNPRASEPGSCETES